MKPQKPALPMTPAQKKFLKINHINTAGMNRETAAAAINKLLSAYRAEKN